MSIEHWRRTRLPRLAGVGRVTLVTLAVGCLVFSAGALAAGGTVQAWGWNQYGQLGNGTISDSAPTMALGGLSGVTQVAGGPGSYHSLALLSNGTVSAWGYNGFGELGNGTINNSSTPGAVSGLSRVVAIAGGGHSLALLSNGTVVAWGYNAHGELGNGSDTGPDNCAGSPCSKTPVAVSGLSHVVAIAAGDDYSLALLSNGTVMAWGDNLYGQLGNGNATGPDSCVGSPCSKTPVAVSGLSGVAAIAAGSFHSLAVLSNGTVVAWGDNAYGELGNAGHNSSTPVAVSGLSGVTQVAGGEYHSLALRSNGTVMAWGMNVYGQLGNGTIDTISTPHPTPTPVSGLAGVMQVAAGQYHSLALRSNGTVMAWGADAHDQLGNGTGESNSSTPREVVELPLGVTQLSAGSSHSLALVGSSQALSVSFAGAGAGTVAGSGILCLPACLHRYPKGEIAILRAQPAARTGFAGFSGACTGTGICTVQMSQDRSVAATFGPPKGTKIIKAKITNKRHTAALSFSAPGAVTGFQCELIPPTKKRHKRPKVKFASCRSPKTYKKLQPGTYAFKVRALDILGADATPAVKTLELRR